MMLALLLQAAAPSDKLVAGAETFDVAKVPPHHEACGEPHEQGEVVVCAGVQREYVLRDEWVEKPFTADVELPGNWHASATAEQRGPPGMQVPALMFNLKLPF